MGIMEIELRIEQITGNRRFVVFPSIYVPPRIFELDFLFDYSLSQYQKVLDETKKVIKNTAGSKRALFTPIDYDYYFGYKRISKGKILKQVTPSSLTTINGTFENFVSDYSNEQSYSILLDRECFIHSFYVKNHESQFMMDSLITLMSIFKEELGYEI